MINLFKYNFRIFLRNRDQLIWNTLFPFVYMLIYVMAMHNLATDALEVPKLKLALVAPQNQATVQDHGGKATPSALALRDFFAYMEDEAVEADLTDQGLLAPDQKVTDKTFVVYREASSYEEAEQWLKNGWVYALVQEVPGQSPRVEVMDRSSQIQPLVLEQLLKIYGQINKQIEIYGDAVKEGRISVLQALSEGLKSGEGQTIHQLDPAKQEKPVPMVNIFYFSLVAYLSFYPVNSGSFVVIATEADRSPEGMRQTVSPYSKRKRFMGSFVPYLCLILLNTCLFYLVIRLLGVNLGSHHALVLLGMGITTLAAMLTGACLAALFGFNQSVLIALSIGLPLAFAMTTGMMSEVIYSSLMKSAPWLIEINPVGMLSKALYQLNGGGGIALYWQEIARLATFCLVAFILTLIGLRRNAYESL